MRNFLQKPMLLAFIILGIGVLFVIVGVRMFQKDTVTKLENFDDYWGLGEPVLVEKKFLELLPEAQVLENKSIYLQLLSQVALTQALQKKFDEAHATLDRAEALCSPEYKLAQARILLERGRVFQQAGNISEAKKYFEKSFEVSKENNFDYHTINAAHMIAIVADATQDKIAWNQQALDMALKTSDTRASLWLGSLYNNLGQNYLEEKQFEKALSAFKQALEQREKEGYVPNIRFAKWAVARALRSLERLDEALSIQLALVKEYDIVAQSGNYDMPTEMFTLTRGWVYEELAEIYQAKAEFFAALAYKELADNVMFTTLEQKRLERIKEIKK